MGKVASMAWMEASQPAARLAATTPVHAHFLTTGNLRSIESILAVSPRNNITNPLAARYILREGLKGQAAVDAAKRNREKIRVITGVRDPISRSLSLLSFFADFCGSANRTLSARDNAAADDVCAALVELWRAVLDQTEPEGSFERLAALMIGAYRTWFSEELKAVFGLDILATPFPAGGGAQQIEGSGVDFLLYRTEDLTQRTSARQASLFAAERFLGTSVELPELNTASTRRSYPLYRQTRDRFRLPAEMLDEIYQAPVVRHFYSVTEIAAFKAQWANP